MVSLDKKRSAVVKTESNKQMTISQLDCLAIKLLYGLFAARCLMDFRGAFRPIKAISWWQCLCVALTARKAVQMIRQRALRRVGNFKQALNPLIKNQNEFCFSSLSSQIA